MKSVCCGGALTCMARFPSINGNAGRVWRVLRDEIKTLKNTGYRLLFLAPFFFWKSRFCGNSRCYKLMVVFQFCESRRMPRLALLRDNSRQAWDVLTGQLRRTELLHCSVL